ncbi:S41 family peptidase [Arsenicibacter rosenii]|uniref:Peptidase S41 n=1 Tax=Arsenicibacter rosenii TaxID=1750698 RepID=A0A1S2VCJ5_9BACT|nr:S41 family peptidase [Arsenicibacter rosenii]OIN56433.1 peptidase S41 [Arsenicibacter rosenii]
MLHSTNWRSMALGLSVGASVWLTGCQKTENVQPSVTTSTTSVAVNTENQTVNNWILTNMQYYYYWNDKIPTTVDKNLNPSDYFSGLLYKYDATARPDGDRFSWIQQSADELTAALSGESKTDGMEFQLYIRPNTTDDIVGSVLYVLPNSPAAKAGIKRGDMFFKVDGQKMTRSNYSSLLSSATDTKQYGFLKVENGALVETSDVKTVTAVVFQEDPVYMDSVYTVGAKKIGYLVYNQFVPGPNGSAVATYDQKLDNIFIKFKQQGVNELILDFRYNPGGYVSSATNLASSIAKNVTTSSVFARKEWNKTITPDLEKQYGKNFFYDYFQTKAGNIGSNLQRVFVLTTGRSASASELVINGLKPYMTVTTIGTKSYGKNVGSVTISDSKKQIKWGMQPIVSKSFNSLGQSDYNTGFTPAVTVSEPLNPRPFGDVSEALLNEALFQITGSRLARRAIVAEVNAPTPIASTIERKAGGSNMFIELPK